MASPHNRLDDLLPNQLRKWAKIFKLMQEWGISPSILLTLWFAHQGLILLDGYTHSMTDSLSQLTTSFHAYAETTNLRLTFLERDNNVQFEGVTKNPFHNTLHKVSE